MNTAHQLPERGWLQSPAAQLFVGACAIVLATFAAYGPALHGGFLWDDDLYITSNPLLSAPDGLQRIWFSAHRHSEYCPLVLTVFRIEYGLWGLNPFGYHVVNVWLHGVNALLLWAVLQRLAVPGAWLAAAIFAVHPVQVESVAWITELKNTQSTLFYLLALLAWMKCVDRAVVRPSGFYVLALLLHALALLSKTTACTLPAAMLLVLWMRHEPIGVRRLIQIAPFLALGIGLGLVAVWWETQIGNYVEDVGQSLSGNARLLIATRALWFYAGKLVWPVWLTFSYPRWEINSRDPFQYLWLIGCVAVAWLLWRRRQAWGRSPVGAVCFFVAGLSPLLGFIPVYTFRYSFVADHYQYLACSGLIAIMAAAWARAGAKWGLNRGWAGAGAALLLLGLSVLTWRQAGVYRDLETLWEDTLAKNPGSWMAHNNLGAARVRQGRLTEAVGHYKEVVRLKPDAATHNDLGSTLFQLGKVPEAVVCFERALQIRPEYDMAHNNLGNALFQLGRVSEAMGHYQAALRSNPNFADAHNNLGTALLGLGKVAEAIGHFEQALRLKPAYVQAHNNLGTALARQGKAVEAMGQYEAALRIAPADADAHYNLGRVLLQQERVAEAVEHLGAAVRLKPADAEAQMNLGVALFQASQVREAIERLEQALWLKPEYAEARNNLGLARFELAEGLAAEGKWAEAIGLYERAVEMKPDLAPAHAGLGWALSRSGRYGEAVASFQQALELDPQLESALNNLAWVLATCPEASVRNGARAVVLAERANGLTGGKDAGVLDTLAAAYAEVGRFNEAMKAAERGAAQARAAGNINLAALIGSRLAHYRAGWPYRNKPGEIESRSK